MNKQVAIYAETDDERQRLREYVRSRGWKTSGREYGPREWKEMVATANKRGFCAICASFDGLWWIAPVTKEVEFERLLPKIGSPPSPPKGRVPGGDAAIFSVAVPIMDSGTVFAVREIAEALFATGLAEGNVRSVKNIVLNYMRRCGIDVWGDKVAIERWKVHGRAAASPEEGKVHETGFRALVSAVADELEKRARAGSSVSDNA